MSFLLMLLVRLLLASSNVVGDRTDRSVLHLEISEEVRSLLPNCYHLASNFRCYPLNRVDVVMNSVACCFYPRSNPRSVGGNTARDAGKSFQLFLRIFKSGPVHTAPIRPGDRGAGYGCLCVSSLLTKILEMGPRKSGPEIWDPKSRNWNPNLWV